MTTNILHLRKFIVTLPFLAAFFVWSCDSVFEVENPGSITDTGLNTVLAIPPITVGVAGDFAVAFGNNRFVCLADGMVTDDIQHVGSFPDMREVDNPLPKVFSLENGFNNTMYQSIARARWVADDAIRRIKQIAPDTVWQRNANVAAIYVFGGFSYVWLADLYNGAPLDGGPKVSRQELYNKAIERFQQAIVIGTNASNPALPGRVATSVGSTSGAVPTAATGATWALRARAGLARVYHITGNLNQAFTEANTVLTSPGGSNFVFYAVYSLNSGRENNSFYTWNLVRNEISVSPDARALFTANPTDTRIRTTRATGSGGLGGDGQRQWWLQSKYTNSDSPIRVSGWQEMELIRAEYYHRNGNLTEAVNAINRVRAAVSGLAPRPASTDANQVLDWIKYERRAEFFWEGRRMADLRYFGETSKIKLDPPFFPIPSSERNTNPNPMD